MAWLPPESDQIQAEPIFVDELVLVVSARHPLANLEQVHCGNYTGFRLLSQHQPPTLDAWSMRSLRKRILARRSAWRSMIPQRGSRLSNRERPPLWRREKQSIIGRDYELSRLPVQSFQGRLAF